jgi:hypothetical protein
MDELPDISPFKARYDERGAPFMPISAGRLPFHGNTKN